MPTNHFASEPRVALPGSERPAFSPQTMPAALLAHSVAANGDGSAEDLVTASVVVRRKQPLSAASLERGSRLTREEFEKQHGADPTAVGQVKQFAAEFGLTVEREPNHMGGGYRTLHLEGTRAAMQAAFGVTLTDHTTREGTLRVREGSVMLPQSLAGSVEAVLGLDNRPVAKPHCRVATPHASNVSYTPVQVAGLYGFPTGAEATGQTVGLIELGGGFRPADITAYFASLNLPAPTVTAVSVDKGKNKPGSASGSDGEVMLDIEVCAAVAPGVKLAVYFAPNTTAGFADAISQAVHDTVNKPSVISISWGGPESTWTAQATTVMDEACQSAAALGVTITVAAGDNGSSDGVTGDGASGTGNHVDFPASSPHVLACGGTKLVGSGTTITSEVVWNEEANNEGATGGGVSVLFAKPAWQASANVPASGTSAGGRGVPDVAGDADPASGYTVRVDGQTMVIGGTSAVAPLWAGLIALANAANKVDAGFVNPTLYGTPAAFRDITQGNNGAFSAGPGWDACTGLGTPIAPAVIKAVA